MMPEADWARGLHYLEPGGEGVDLLLSRPPRLVRSSLYLLCILLLVALAWAWLSKVEIYITSRGAVRPQGDVAKVQAIAPGRITSVKVTDGEEVRAGDVLFVLDQREMQTGLSQVANELDGTRKRLEVLRRNLATMADQHRAQAVGDRFSAEGAGVGVARAHQEELARQADLEKARTIVAGARLDWERKQRLFKENIISDAEVKIAENQLHVTESAERATAAELEIARQGVLSAEKNFRLLEKRSEAGNHERDRESENLAAEILELEEKERGLQLDEVRLRTSLDHLEIRAPVDGIVTTVGARNVGEVAQLGTVMATIAPKNAPWVVESWVSNNDAGPLREKLGARVKLKFDAFPFRDYGTLSGRLIEVSPDADLSTPLGNAYRVRIAMDSLRLGRGGRQGRVRLGMTATAEIVKEEHRVLLLLFHNARDRVAYD